MALPIEDKREIEDLFTRYSYFFDGLLSRDAFLSLFTDDAVLVSPFHGRIAGRSGIEAFADHVVSNVLPTQQMRHVVTNVAIDGSGDEAVMTVYQLIYTTKRGTPWPKTEFLYAGHYECTLVRAEGTWKIHRRIDIADPITGGPNDKSGVASTLARGT
jgi:uncharacterized protein (TIGR02246 family)